MEENTNTTQKVVTLESLEEASKLLATKKEVDAKIKDAVSTCASIAFATTEEVLAIFGKTAAKEPESETPEA